MENERSLVNCAFGCVDLIPTPVDPGVEYAPLIRWGLYWYAGRPVLVTAQGQN